MHVTSDLNYTVISIHCFVIRTWILVWQEVHTLMDVHCTYTPCLLF